MMTRKMSTENINSFKTEFFEFPFCMEIILNKWHNLQNRLREVTQEMGLLRGKQHCINWLLCRYDGNLPGERKLPRRTGGGQWRRAAASHLHSCVNTGNFSFLNTGISSKVVRDRGDLSFKLIT